MRGDSFSLASGQVRISEKIICNHDRLNPRGSSLSER